MKSNSETTPSPEELERVAGVLDSLATSASDPWDLLQKLWERRPHEHKTAPENLPVVTCYIERALAYAFVDDPKPNRLGAVVLGCRFSSAQGNWPPAFDKTTAEEKKAWSDTADRCKEPLPRAHLLDLALLTGVCRGRDRAKEIAELYVKVAGTDNIDSYYQAMCLRRVWSIARQYNLPDLEAQGRQLAFTAAEKLTFVEGVSSISVLLQLFELLVCKPRYGDFENPTRHKVQEMLKILRSWTWRDVALAEDVTELLVRVTNNKAEKYEAWRLLIQALLSIAETETGMRASLQYQKAADMAKRHECHDLYEYAIQGLQEHPLGRQDMHTVSSELVIPRYVNDHRLAIYRQCRNFGTALDIWLVTPSPLGKYDSNLEFAKSATEGSLQSLSTRVTYDQGLPTRTTEPVDSVEFYLERAELLKARIYGTLLAHELEAINTEYGEVSTKDVTTHLSLQYQCDATLAEAFSKALVSFWEKRYSDAGRASFPLVEAGARGLLKLLGKPLYRIQTGKSDGKFPSLEKYIEELEKVDFDIDWLRCLRNPVSVWRNALAHGHRFCLPKNEAAVLLRMAALLVVLSPDDASEKDREEVEGRLRDPISWVARRSDLVPHWRQIWSLSWEAPDADDNSVIS